MAVRSYADVEFGQELPELTPDIRMETVKRFTDAAHMSWARFNDHAEARKQGLPGAIVPGIMSQGILAALIHHWAPNAEIHNIDTIFRAPLLVDTNPVANGVVTDIDDEARVIEIDLMIKNEKGETPVVGTARISL